MKVTPNLHFRGDCKEALKLYEKAFDGKLTLLMHYRDAHPSDYSTANLSEKEKDFVYHALITIGNQRFIFSDSEHEIPQGLNPNLKPAG
jgi:PhnB protein